MDPFHFPAAAARPVQPQGQVTSQDILDNILDYAVGETGGLEYRELFRMQDITLEHFTNYLVDVKSLNSLFKISMGDGLLIMKQVQKVK